MVRIKYRQLCLPESNCAGAAQLHVLMGTGRALGTLRILEYQRVSVLQKKTNPKNNKPKKKNQRLFIEVFWQLRAWKYYKYFRSQRTFCTGAETIYKEKKKR